MSLDYARMAATASDLLGTGQFGQAFTFARQGEGAFNPATGQVEGGNAVNVQVSGVVVPLRPEEAEQFTADTLQEGKVRALVVEAGDVQLGDSLALDGSTWSVKAVSATDPAGTEIVRRVIVTR